VTKDGAGVRTARPVRHPLPPVLAARGRGSAPELASSSALSQGAEEPESRLAAMARLVEHLHKQQIQRRNHILSSYGRLPMRAEVEDDGSSSHQGPQESASCRNSHEALAHEVGILLVPPTAPPMQQLARVDVWPPPPPPRWSPAHGYWAAFACWRPICSLAGPHHRERAAPNQIESNRH
jgi:hypothetical protein